MTINTQAPGAALRFIDRLVQRPLRLFVVLAALTLLLYLGASLSSGYFGYSLDDAWIHQTYARNLGTRGEFAFVPGEPSAGSTSPLWSALIALGYALQLEPHAWTYTLGALSLALNAWLAFHLARQYWPERRLAAVLAGGCVALEWHLAWASVSGMETALFAALALAAFVIPPQRALWLGLVVGVSVLVRPDGLTLLPFALLRTLEADGRRWREALACLVGFAAIVGPYLACNVWLEGQAWPNTFYAKQAEYAIYRELPWLTRLSSVALQPFIGAQMLAVPGLAAFVWRRVQDRAWARLIPLAWVALFLAAYILRLPVTYQYGRYVMPVIPIVTVLGAGGMMGLLRLREARLWPRVLSRAWVVAYGLLALTFWAIGAGLYARDVRIIETEMVATARWISIHTPAEALIAAHDIGALGYYGGRRLLDLAGLVSPEVIPFLRDEDRLRDWLTASGADYLMTFPGWYPDLAEALKDHEVFRTRAPFSPQAGGENMVVYRLPPSITGGLPPSIKGNWPPGQR